MGQDLVIICHKCKKIIWLGCRFSNINKSKVQEVFENHKYHDIKPCGNDGGGDLIIGKYSEEGYESEHI